MLLPAPFTKDSSLIFLLHALSLHPRVKRKYCFKLSSFLSVSNFWKKCQTNRSKILGDFFSWEFHLEIFRQLFGEVGIRDIRSLARGNSAPASVRPRHLPSLSPPLSPHRNNNNNNSNQNNTRSPKSTLGGAYQSNVRGNPNQSKSPFLTDVSTDDEDLEITVPVNNNLYRNQFSEITEEAGDQNFRDYNSFLTSPIICEHLRSGNPLRRFNKQRYALLKDRNRE